jgi:formylglycine-generating enzyme required for sulfatase activity
MHRVIRKEIGCLGGREGVRMEGLSKEMLWVDAGLGRGEVTTLASVDRGDVVVGYSTGQVTILEGGSGHPRWSRQLQGGAITHLCVLEEEQALALWTAAGELVVLGMKAGELLARHAFFAEGSTIFDLGQGGVVAITQEDDVVALEKKRWGILWRISLAKKMPKAPSDTDISDCFYTMTERGFVFLHQDRDGAVVKEERRRTGHTKYLVMDGDARAWFASERDSASLSLVDVSEQTRLSVEGMSGRGVWTVSGCRDGGFGSTGEESMVVGRWSGEVALYRSGWGDVEKVAELQLPDTLRLAPLFHKKRWIFLTERGLLAQIHPERGRIVSQKRLDALPAAFTILPRGELVVATRGGEVICYRSSWWEGGKGKQNAFVPVTSAKVSLDVTYLPKASKGREKEEEGQGAATEKTTVLVAGSRKVFTVGKAEIAMRWVPAGEFWMGSAEDDSEAWPEEKPRRLVRITRGFWMMETPVTQRQYKAITGKNPSHFSRSGWDVPVEMVTWQDAAAFANALSALEGLPCAFASKRKKLEGVADYLGCGGWRLPTEAEWEYAARAGTTGARYGEVEEIGWYKRNSNGKTQPVGQKEPNAWGFYDMLGNVDEWVFDFLDERAYDKLPSVDPIQRKGGASVPHLTRGGSYSNSEARWLRAAIRIWFSKGENSCTIGFRLVRGG